MSKTHGFLLAGFAAAAVGLAVLAGIAMLGSGLGDAVWPGPARTSQPPGLLVVDPGRGGAPVPGAQQRRPRDRVEAGASAPAPALVIAGRGVVAVPPSAALPGDEGSAGTRSAPGSDRRRSANKTPSKKAPAPTLAPTPTSGGGSPTAPATESPVAGAAPATAVAATPSTPAPATPTQTDAGRGKDHGGRVNSHGKKVGKRDKGRGKQDKSAVLPATGTPTPPPAPVAGARPTPAAPVPEVEVEEDGDDDHGDKGGKPGKPAKGGKGNGHGKAKPKH